MVAPPCLSPGASLGAQVSIVELLRLKTAPVPWKEPGKILTLTLGCMLVAMHIACTA